MSPFKAFKNQLYKRFGRQNYFFNNFKQDDQGYFENIRKVDKRLARQELVLIFFLKIRLSGLKYWKIRTFTGHNTSSKQRCRLSDRYTRDCTSRKNSKIEREKFESLWNEKNHKKFE